MLEHTAASDSSLPTRLKWNVLKLEQAHARCAVLILLNIVIVIRLTCYVKKAEFFHHQSKSLAAEKKHYGFQGCKMSKCPRRNISCWQHWISWTTFVKIHYYTQHTSCQFKYSCDRMIGLTCSWASSIGPTLSLLLPSVSSPPWLPRGGGELQPVSLSFFLSLSQSPPHPFLFLSISLCVSFHWWATCQQLLLWQAVKALHVTEWYIVFFPPWKDLFLSSECFIGGAQSLIGDNVSPKLRDLSLEMRERVVFSLLHCVRWLLFRKTLCAEALGVTQCSLHQSSNEAVATLAPAPIEPRTDSLPGGSVFQSTGPPCRLPPFSTRTHPPPPLPLQPL